MRVHSVFAALMFVLIAACSNDGDDPAPTTDCYPIAIIDSSTNYKLSEFEYGANHTPIKLFTFSNGVANRYKLFSSSGNQSMTQEYKMDGTLAQGKSITLHDGSGRSIFLYETRQASSSDSLTTISDTIQYFYDATNQLARTFTKHWSRVTATGQIREHDHTGEDFTFVENHISISNVYDTIGYPSTDVNRSTTTYFYDQSARRIKYSPFGGVIYSGSGSSQTISEIKVVVKTVRVSSPAFYPVSRDSTLYDYTLNAAKFPTKCKLTISSSSGLKFNFVYLFTYTCP